MKLHELIEMTMKVSSYEQLGEYLHMFDSYKTDGVHVGDIEKFKVFKISSANVDRYAVFFGDDTTAIAYFVMKPTLSLLDVIFVSKPFRKMGLFSAILFFIKRNEGYGRIVLGDLHSFDTIAAIKRIHSRFDTYWEKDGERHLYSPDTVDKYYNSMKSTGWVIVLENDGDFSSWPKFFEGLTLSTYYFPLLENE